jgi:hypothetical protein
MPSSSAQRVFGSMASCNHEARRSPRSKYLTGKPPGLRINQSPATDSCYAPGPRGTTQVPLANAEVMRPVAHPLTKFPSGKGNLHQCDTDTPQLNPCGRW